MNTLDLGQWCILRMSSANTLAVHDSLKRAGFEVWTPIETMLPKPLGLFPSRRNRLRAQEDRKRALLPSFVFADVVRANDLARIALVPNREHRAFWLFRDPMTNGYPLVAEAGLRPLRELEDKLRRSFLDRKRRGRKPPPIPKGTEVRIPGGLGFDGLIGTVQRQHGRQTFLEVEGFAHSIQIASVMLVDEDEQEMGIAA